MRFQKIAALLVLGMCALPVFAAENSARTNTLVNLYAGPDDNYPVVATIARDVSLNIEGCLDDYSWCDVLVSGNLRGWVYGDYINYSRTGSSGTVRRQGVSIRLPVISFTQDSYWENHYRNRPWYHDRSRRDDQFKRNDRSRRNDRSTRVIEPIQRPHSPPPLPPIHNLPRVETLPPIHARPAPMVRSNQNVQPLKSNTLPRINQSKGSLRLYQERTP